MKDKQNILFSERFQEIYDLLGVFCYLSALSENRGVDPREIKRYDATDRLPVLLSHYIIKEEAGRLFLDWQRFAGMTVWDLLLISEPWLDNTPEAGSDQMYENLKSFTSAERLSISYMNIGP